MVGPFPFSFSSNLAFPIGLSPPLRYMPLTDLRFFFDGTSSLIHQSCDTSIPLDLSSAQRISTMKSVSLPVSSLMPRSDTMSEEAGVIKSRDPLNRILRYFDAVEGSVRLYRSTAPLERSRSFVPRRFALFRGALELRRNSSGIETTVQRIAAPRFGMPLR